MKTERDGSRAGDAGDTIPEQANVYVPPRPLAALAEHRTMDVKAIRLAAGVDPRQAATELRLYAPPPLKKDKSWIPPLLLALVAVGFIGLWWITPEPLPLDVTSARSRATPAVRAEAEAVPAPAVTQARTAVPVAAPPPDAPLVAPGMTVAPGMAVAPSTAVAPDMAVAPSTVVAPAPLGPPAAPSGNHRPKPGRDPWLE